MDTTLEHKNFESLLKGKAYPQDIPALWQFPKEFKRNWFGQFDPRFMIILLLTFIFEIGMIIFLLALVRGSGKNLDVNSIQKRYANLLLDKHSNDTFSDETMSDGTYLYGVSEEIALAVNSQPDGIENASRVYANNSQSASSNRDRFTQSNGGQSFGNRSSNSGSGSSAAGIGSIGLLQYLVDENNASNEELQEIYAQGDRYNQYLEGSLANVKLGGYINQGGPSRSGAGTETATFISGLKGAKSNVSPAEVRSSVAPLEKASFSTVTKNTELEESFVSVLNKTGSKASARKAEHVTGIVLNHNRSIQDCYKQALKKQSDIKGKVVVRFSVTPAGTVDHVEVITSTINYEPMIKCIINRIHRWNDFGESDISLGTVSYRQTYVFGY
jgi:hypothetical protein